MAFMPKPPQSPSLGFISRQGNFRSCNLRRVTAAELSGASPQLGPESLGASPWLSGKAETAVPVLRSFRSPERRLDQGSSLGVSETEAERRTLILRRVTAAELSGASPQLGPESLGASPWLSGKAEAAVPVLRSFRSPERRLCRRLDQGSSLGVAETEAERRTLILRRVTAAELSGASPQLGPESLGASLWLSGKAETAVPVKSGDSGGWLEGRQWPETRRERAEGSTCCRSERRQPSGRAIAAERRP